METQYDVIVIGGGPAGATVATHLARAGVKTLLLEKAKLPRYKPCGGGLSVKVTRIADFDFMPFVEDTITRMVIAYRNRPVADLRAPQPMAWCVMRDRFDEYLVERAAGAGAVLHDGETVKGITFAADQVCVTTRAGQYRAAVVVGADGSTGITAREAGIALPQAAGAALEVEMAVPAAQQDEWRGAFYLDFGACPDGYGWIFPKRDHLSVGLGVFSVSAGAKARSPESAPNLRALLKSWMAAEPSLQEHRDLLARGHLVPIHTTSGPLHGRRVLLVGDAGQLVNPFTGEGIYFAMRSGMLAAEVIRAALERGDLDLAAYSRRLFAEFRPHYLGARGLGRLFYHIPAFSLKTMGRSRFLQGQIIRHMLRPAEQPSRMVRVARRIGAMAERL